MPILDISLVLGDGETVTGAFHLRRCLIREALPQLRHPLQETFAFLHDEFILEVPAHREKAHLASERVQALMVEGMQRFVPDVPIKAEPTLMDRWYKEAEPVYGADGVLELWKPKA